MDLDLLGYTQSLDHAHSAADCPSWVPRWDIYVYSTIYKSASRRHSSQFPDRLGSTPCLVDRNTLKVRGVRIGSVQHVTETFSTDMALESLGKIWQQVKIFGTGLQLGGKPYYASATKAFLGTLAAADYTGDPDEGESRQAIYMDCIQRRTSQQVEGSGRKRIPSATVEGGKEEVMASVAEMHYHIMYTAHNRRLVVSEGGYYALASLTAEKGDVLCIILGTKTPFLLRQASAASPGGAQKYRLLGDVFMFSARGAENGDRLLTMGNREGYDDWKDRGLQEQDMLIC